MYDVARLRETVNLERLWHLFNKNNHLAITFLITYRKMYMRYSVCARVCACACVRAYNVYAFFTKTVKRLLRGHFTYLLTLYSSSSSSRATIYGHIQHNRYVYPR